MRGFMKVKNIIVQASAPVTPEAMTYNCLIYLLIFINPRLRPVVALQLGFRHGATTDPSPAFEGWAPIKPGQGATVQCLRVGHRARLGSDSPNAIY